MLWLTLLGAAAMTTDSAPAAAWSKPAAPVLTDEQAWAKLPPLKSGSRGPLPTWARMLAGPMPTTASAMIEFDATHRLRSPLDKKLRARLRTVIASTNRCPATLAAALGDLERAGVAAEEVALWKRGDLDAASATASATDQRALAFVRKATRRAAEVSDDEFSKLIADLGEANTVAVVLLTAGANFHDRLLHAYGLANDTTASGPPLDVRFDRTGEPRAAPPRVFPKTSAPKEDWSPTERLDPNWGKFKLEELRSFMEVQKGRAPRIRVPTSTEYLAATEKFPVPVSALMKNKAKGKGKGRAAPKIVWSLVCGGYQPELAAAWSQNTNSFRQDAKQDRVFEESLFWIVTRSIDCFY